MHKPGAGENFSPAPGALCMRSSKMVKEGEKGKYEKYLVLNKKNVRIIPSKEPI